MGTPSSITKIDSKTIGEMPADQQACDEARDALVAADLPAGFDISKLTARNKVGKFAAMHAAGNIMAESIMYRDTMAKVSAILLEELEMAKEPERKVMLADAINRTIANHAALATVELKVVEITAHGNKKKTRNTLAPQIISENTIINMSEPKETVEGRTIDVHS